MQMLLQNTWCLEGDVSFPSKGEPQQSPGNAESIVIKFLTILKINLCSAITSHLCLIL